MMTSTLDIKGLTLDINGICNLACGFCYQDLDGQALSKEAIFRLVDAHPSARVVNIGGGEPFLHPDILTIIEGIALRERLAHVSTNATVLPNGLLDLDAKVRERTRIQASINAATRETYARVTGHDLFARVLANVDRLREAYAVTLSAVLYQENIDDFDGLLALGYERQLPVRLDLVKPAGKGRAVALLTPEQANWVRGRVLLENIARPGAVYGPLVHEVTCPLLQETYALGTPANATCPGGNNYVVFTPGGVRRACEFRASDTEQRHNDSSR